MEQQYDWDGFTPDEIEDIQSYVYDQTGVDSAIEEVKEINEEVNRLEELLNQRIEKLKFELSLKVGKLEKRKDFHINNIKTFTLQSTNKKETKTQYKLSMISGDIVIKKTQDKLINRLDKVNKMNSAIIADNLPEYKKEKITTELDWSGMKSNLEIRIVDGNKIVWDTKLNKDVSEYVSIEQTPEEVVIK